MFKMNWFKIVDVLLFYCVMFPASSPSYSRTAESNNKCVGCFQSRRVVRQRDQRLWTSTFTQISCSRFVGSVVSRPRLMWHRANLATFYSFIVTFFMNKYHEWNLWLSSAALQRLCAKFHQHTLWFLSVNSVHFPL